MRSFFLMAVVVLAVAGIGVASAKPASAFLLRSSEAEGTGSATSGITNTAMVRGDAFASLARSLLVAQATAPGARSHATAMG